jgi:hypothetical protein
LVRAKLDELHSKHVQFEMLRTAEASLFFYEQCSLVKATLVTIRFELLKTANASLVLYQSGFIREMLVGRS